MPGISKSSYLARLHSTAAEVSTLHQDHIKIDKDAAGKLGSELAQKADDVKAAALRHLTFPIKFDNIEAEVTFLAMYHMLAFGSGWDKQLKQRGQRGASETMQFGVLGMHISGQRMDHHWMKAFSPLHVHNFFGIESHEDQPVEGLPGVTMSRPGALHPLVVSIQQVISETGQALEEEGSSSLGGHVLGLVEGARGSGQALPASSLAEELAGSLPGFQDQGLYDGQQVQFARKAQALVGALHGRFGAHDPRFAFADVGQLTADSGPEVPAVLRAQGVLSYSDDLASTIDAGDELPSGPHERALRAAAIAASDAIVDAAGGAFTAHELGCYLRTLAEDLGQEVHMHSTKSTAF